jgi:cell wall-associated NlpC family hydrolase
VALLDPRLHAYREDLADEKLKGQVQAAHWVQGFASNINVPVAVLRKMPDQHALQLTQALFGEVCCVFEIRNGWAWVQLQDDGYVGYIREESLAAHAYVPTHRVANVTTWRFPSCDLKTQPATPLFMNSRVAVESVNGNYAVLQSGGAVFAGHLRGLKQFESDFVAVAERFLHVPYYWGGKTCAGTDCSGLVQISLQACGIAVLRDSDMQENSLGILVKNHKIRQRGDLVFWPGHVGIMQSATQLLHANGHFMMVTSEPLAHAIARSDKPVSSVRRLSAQHHIPAAK